MPNFILDYTSLHIYAVDLRRLFVPMDSKKFETQRFGLHTITQLVPTTRVDTVAVAAILSILGK